MGAAAGAALLARRTTNVRAAASQPKTAVRFALPAGACDCHTHIFSDSQRFPLAADRVYTPEPASIEEMRALHRALRMERVVIVQPSIYATDNACTLDAVRQLGSRARAVAVIDDKVSAAALDAMHDAGVRGVRINLATSGQTDPAVARRRLQTAGEQLKGRPWHIQMYTTLPIVAAIRDQVAASPIPVVFDHFGGAQASLHGTAGVQRAAGSRPIRQGLRQDLRRLPQLECAARLRGRGAAREGAHRREPPAHRLGQRLAASRFVERGRPRGDRRRAAAADRRWPPVESARDVGAERCAAQDDPRR